MKKPKKMALVYACKGTDTTPAYVMLGRKCSSNAEIHRSKMGKAYMKANGIKILGCVDLPRWYDDHKV